MHLKSTLPPLFAWKAHHQWSTSDLYFSSTIEAHEKFKIYRVPRHSAFFFCLTDRYCALHCGRSLYSAQYNCLTIDWFFLGKPQPCRHSQQDPAHVLSPMREYVCLLMLEMAGGGVPFNGWGRKQELNCDGTQSKTNTIPFINNILFINSDILCSNVY